MNSNTFDAEQFYYTSFLFEYPEDGFIDRVKGTQKFLSEAKPLTALKLKPFIDFLELASLEEVQDLFTRTYEVQAATTLDLGYLLFGDDYKRAELLVNLSREHKDAGNDCGIELADHLPNVLRLLAKMEDVQLLNDLVIKLLGPALKKMLSDFEPKNLQSKNKVYQKHHKTIIELDEQFGLINKVPLEVLYDLVKDGFALEESETEKKSDFLRSIGQEMKIEG